MDARTIWKFDAWVKFSEGGGGHRTCYIGHPDEAEARRLMLAMYPGSRMDGDAAQLSQSACVAETSRTLQNEEIYVVG